MQMEYCGLRPFVCAHIQTTANNIYARTYNDRECNNDIVKWDKILIDTNNKRIIASRV